MGAGIKPWSSAEQLSYLSGSISSPVVQVLINKRVDLRSKVGELKLEGLKAVHGGLGI